MSPEGGPRGPGAEAGGSSPAAGGLRRGPRSTGGVLSTPVASAGGPLGPRPGLASERLSVMWDPTRGDRLAGGRADGCICGCF